jgi:hypothetical protein
MWRLITGHTSPTGPAAPNDSLSLELDPIDPCA